MNRNNYAFSKQIYKSIREDGSVRQIVSIDIKLKDSKLCFPTPFNAFLMEYQNRKTSTVALIAGIITQFLNYVFFEMYPPISTIQELTLQHGISFLSSISCRSEVKTQYAEYLTKFYFFCHKKDMAALDDIDFFVKCNSQQKEYIANIFVGKYEVIYKKSIDAIHEIDIVYLPMLFDTAKDIAPDIYLGLLLQFAGGLRASEIVSVEYGNIGFINDGGIFALKLKLEDKDLRPDLSTAFIAKVKRNRTQIVLPIFGDRLKEAYETHVKLYRRENVNAVFIDKNGNPMTVNTYWKRFNRVKKNFIKRLYECQDLEVQEYALFLECFRWSTHIGRGTFSNIVAENANNIGEIAIIRGDTNLSSSLPYLNDNRSVEKKVQNTFKQFYRGDCYGEDD